MTLDPKILDMPQFRQPDNWRWHHFKSTSGHTLRFGTASPQDTAPKAIVICLPGFREFGEKYFEIANDLIARGYSFWTLDWVGQGGSDRILPDEPDKVHSVGFKQNVYDLNRFIADYVRPSATHPKAGRIPVVILAHSMGAHIALRYLHKYPSDFIRAAVLSAPLIRVQQFAKYPALVSLFITSILALRPLSFVPGHEKAVKLSKGMEPGKGYSSSDPIRDQIHNLWSETTQNLRMKGPTTKWLYEVIRSCFILGRKAYLKDIKTPVLIGIAGDDRIVSSKATEAIASYLPNGKILTLPTSRHEIMMERDDIRGVFLDAFESFVHKHTAIPKKD